MNAFQPRGFMRICILENNLNHFTLEEYRMEESLNEKIKADRGEIVSFGRKQPPRCGNIGNG